MRALYLGGDNRGIASAGSSFLGHRTLRLTKIKVRHIVVGRDHWFSVLDVGHRGVWVLPVEVLELLISFELLVDLLGDCFLKLVGFHIGGLGQLGEFYFIALGKALAGVELAADQGASPAAALGLSGHGAAVAQPRKDGHGNQQQAQVAEDGINKGDELLEAHEG